MDRDSRTDALLEGGIASKTAENLAVRDLVRLPATLTPNGVRRNRKIRESAASFVRSNQPRFSKI